MLKAILKDRHIERLNAGLCSIQTGLPFLEVVHDLEKISDHCSNIAIYTIQLCEGAEEFDTHAYAKQAYKDTEQFKEKLRFYQQKYVTQINAIESPDGAIG